MRKVAMVLSVMIGLTIIGWSTSAMAIGSQPRAAISIPAPVPPVPPVVPTVGGVTVVPPAPPSTPVPPVPPKCGCHSTPASTPPSTPSSGGEGGSQSNAPSSTSVAPQTGTGSELPSAIANTGTRTQNHLTLALLSIVAGLGLVWLGRPRVLRARHR
jgi:hypothetical protein